MKIISRALVFLFLLLLLVADARSQNQEQKEFDMKPVLDLSTYRIRDYQVVEIKPRIDWKYKGLVSNSESVIKENGLTLNNSLSFKPVKSMPLVVSNRSGTDLFKKYGYMFTETNIYFSPAQSPSFIKLTRNVFTNFAVNEYLKMDKWSKYSETSVYWSTQTKKLGPFSFLNSGFAKFPNNKSFWGQSELLISHKSTRGLGLAVKFDLHDLKARPKLNLRILR